MKTTTKAFASAAAARAATDKLVTKLRADGWIAIPAWPAWPGTKLVVQPYPHPFRERGVFSNCPEQQFELDGTRVVHVRWNYGGAWIKTDITFERTTHRSRAAARAALDKTVAALVAKGWGPLPGWPELPPGWFDGVKRARPDPATVRDPPIRPKKLVPITLGQLRVKPGGKPATARELAALTKAFGALPRAWTQLMSKHGAQTFMGRLRFVAPSKIASTTSGWKKRSSVAVRRERWVNYDQAVPSDASLCLIANSIDGDQVGFCGDHPDALLILPRNADEVVVLHGLPELLGWYHAVAERAGDATTRTYGPER